MSYQVLARKYRPGNFTELVGQEHVTQALINGLEQGRLHHAFLFTGTRGVGKTTLARIIAKALNCEKGVTGSPCGQCDACREIAEGRFVDLVEVDAASRTGVDDTRELLENVQYAPSKGRFKIYLIDEVHMFSNSSFNALLKTLEEPPPHVKFLLATTEPAKLPITVLSRCLQFNLKRLDNEQISQYLASLLGKEKVEYESSALELLARAADGSMRDALSLLDQALAHGAGRIVLKDVRAMLGAIEHRHILDLLEAIVVQDADKLANVMQGLFERSPDYGRVLQDMALLLHEISLQQILGKAPPNALFDRSRVIDFGTRLSPEITQLYYQICVIGHQEMTLAPDAKTGFEATVIRLFGFTLPEYSGRRGGRLLSGEPRQAVDTKPQNMAKKSPSVASQGKMTELSEGREQVVPNEPAVATENTSDRQLPPLKPENWPAIFQALKLKGAARELARHCRVRQVTDRQLHLILSDNHSFTLRDRPRGNLVAALQQAYGQDMQVNITIEPDDTMELSAGQGPAAKVEPSDTVTEMVGSAEQSIHENPLIQSLKKHFDAEVIDVQRHRKRG